MDLYLRISLNLIDMFFSIIIFLAAKFIMLRMETLRMNLLITIKTKMIQTINHFISTVVGQIWIK